MATYPNLEPPPPPNPLIAVLKECIEALRWAQSHIAQPPKRRALEIIADRAEKILARETDTPGGDHDAVA